jgi:hypothetical protein
LRNKGGFLCHKKEGGYMQRPLFIQWQGHNETGIAIIDEQHKGIVSIIN